MKKIARQLISEETPGSRFDTKIEASVLKLEPKVGPPDQIWCKSQCYITNHSEEKRIPFAMHTKREKYTISMGELTNYRIEHMLTYDYVTQIGRFDRDDLFG